MNKIREQIETLEANGQLDSADIMEKLVKALASVGLAVPYPQSTVDLIYECRAAVQTRRGCWASDYNYNPDCADCNLPADLGQYR